MPPTNLEPITPSDAVELYLNDRQVELSDNTLTSYQYKLTRFIKWCDENDIDNCNDLSGRTLLKFKGARTDDLKPVSSKAQLDTLRSFIRFCESIDAVEQDLHNKVQSPSLNRSDRERDVLVEHDQAMAVLDHLARFDYASLYHATIAIMWKCGARTGTIRSFDLADYDSANERIRATHSEETPLKNKSEGERLIALDTDTCVVIDDYIEHNRHDIIEDTGRKPLLTTVRGRVAKPTIRSLCYRCTHPCQYNGGHCPHGRSMDSCQALTGPEKAPSVCPSARSPHAWRRGAITHHLTNDVPVEIVSDRMNVSPDVFDDHYDRRSEDVKVEQRRPYLEGV